jgi:sugar phosphate isomerase/epimerase
MHTQAAFSRRDVLALGGASIPLLFGGKAFAQRKSIPVGIELYSVRNELMRDLPATVTAIAKLGYEVVEFYAPYYDWTEAEAKDVRSLLDDLGIACLSTHNSGAGITPEGLGKAIELNQIIGSRIIVQASAPRATSIDDWKTLGDKLTSFADRLRPFGMRVGYHNHQMEWREMNGQRPMDVIAASTPDDVILQLDVGTCVEVDADPVAWIHANPGRIRSIHCKDWGAGADRGYRVAFGEGDAPWREIFAAAEAVGGVEYYLIEQEQSPRGQELTMAEHCLANWKQLRAGAA